VLQFVSEPCSSIWTPGKVVHDRIFSFDLMTHLLILIGFDMDKHILCILGIVQPIPARCLMPTKSPSFPVAVRSLKSGTLTSSSASYIFVEAQSCKA
jgi:hypothetical protein